MTVFLFAEITAFLFPVYRRITKAWGREDGALGISDWRFAISDWKLGISRI